MNLRKNLITIVCSTLILSGQLWATNISEADEVKGNNYLPSMTEMKQQSEQLDKEYEALINSIKWKEQESRPDTTLLKAMFLVADSLEKKIDQQFASEYQEHYHDFMADLDQQILQAQDLDAQADLKKFRLIVTENKEKLTSEKFLNIYRIMDEKKKNIKGIKYFKDQQQKIEAEIEAQKIDRLKSIEKYSDASPFIIHIDAMLENSQSSYRRNESSLNTLLKETAKLNADIEKTLV